MMTPKSFARRTTRTMAMAALAVALVLPGCKSEKAADSSSGGFGLSTLFGESDNAMDYLPKSSGAYMGMSAKEFRESAGLKRLSDEMNRLQSGAEFQSEKAEKMLMAFEAPTSTGTAPPIYGVAVGQPGFADELVEQYKAAGGQESKMAGRTIYTSGSVSIAPVGKSGVLIFQNENALDRMVKVSKKKEEGARGSAVFNFVNTQLNDHALVVASAAQPLLELGGPFLASFERTDPQAAEALRKASMISVTFDWDQQPVAEVMLHLSDKAGNEALSRTMNMALQLAKGQIMMAGLPPGAQQIIAALRAEPGEDGVRVKVVVPAELAEQLFTSLPQ